MWLKRIGMGVLALLVAAGASACADRNQGSSGSDSGEDMEGYEFTLATIWSYAANPEEGLSEYGDLRQQKYRAVEEKYNCKIKHVALNAVSFSDELASAAAAGIKYYDFFEVDYARFQSNAASFKPLSDLFDTNQPKFNLNVNKATTRDGKVYGVAYDYQRFPVGYLMIYNKTLLKANALEDPYDLVKANNWTYAKFEEMSKALTKRTTGGEVNQWGLAGVDWNTQSIELPFLFANGANVIKKNAEDKWVFAMLDNNAQEALNYMNRLFYTEKVLTSSSSRDLVAGYKAWLEGKVGFFIGTPAYLQHLAGIDTLKGLISTDVKLKDGQEYGIVPMPKGPSGSDYRQVSSDYYMWCMMNGNPDAKKSAKIFNALSDPVYGLYEEDRTEYYETFKSNVLNGDDRMLEMYQLSESKVVVNDAWGLPGIEELSAAVYASTRGVTQTPKAAMESLAGNMEYWIGSYFYGLTYE